MKSGDLCHCGNNYEHVVNVVKESQFGSLAPKLLGEENWLV